MDDIFERQGEVQEAVIMFVVSAT